MKRASWVLLQLVVLAWQIDMAVQAGIAASIRQKPDPKPLPSKQQVQAPPAPACTTGKCLPPATIPR